MDGCEPRTLTAIDLKPFGLHALAPSERFFRRREEFIDILGWMDGCLEMPDDRFHDCMYLGFCMTIHKAQGKTFVEPYTIYDWDHDFCTSRARYVALSRGKRSDQVQIASE